MLPTVKTVVKTGDLLGLRAERSSPYSVYGCGRSALQTVASHPVLTTVAQRLTGISLGLLTLFVLFSPVTVYAAGSPTDGCLSLSDCTRQGGTSQGPTSYCQSGSIYCHNYIPGSDTSGSGSGSGGSNITTDPCGAAGAAVSKITYCVKTEDDCAESPINNGTSLCENDQFCCVKKSTATATPSTGSSGGSVTLPDPLGGVTLPVLVGNIIRSFAGVAGAIALLMFVYGGVMWIISGGDKGKVAKAQSILKNATIGLVLIFGAYFFVAAIIGGILTAPASGS